jgi:hypothetical protein
MPYNHGANEKGVKRNRSPVPQADYYKHNAEQSQGVYMPQKPETGRHETRRAVLWYNPAKYGTSPHQGWPTNNIVTNRYPLPQSVPAPHILHLNNEHQQQPPPQLVKQSPSAPPPTNKSAAISIEKIGENMRAKIPPQQDFTIHRRIGNAPGQGQQQPELLYPNILREF